MALKANDFEVGPAGTSVTVANSDDTGEAALSLVSAGSGGTITYQTLDAFVGTFCAQFVQPTAANQPVCVQMSDGTGASSFACRIYLRLTAYPSAEISLPFQVRSTTDTHICNLAMSTGGLMRIKNGAGTTFASGTSAIPLNSWQRIEYWASGLNGTGTHTAAFYDGHSTSAVEQISSAVVTTTGLTDRIRYGRMGTATLATWKLDGLAQNIGSSTAVGPASVGSDLVRRSAAWVAYTPNVRRSGAWV